MLMLIDNSSIRFILSTKNEKCRSLQHIYHASDMMSMMSLSRNVLWHESVKGHVAPCLFVAYIYNIESPSVVSGM